MKLYITGYCKLINSKLTINDQQIKNYCLPLDHLLLQIVSDWKLVHPRFGKLDRLAQLGYCCAEILLQNLPHFPNYTSENVSIVLANESSSLDTDVRFEKSMHSIPSPSIFVYTLPNIVIAEICIKNKFKGENLFLISDEINAELFLEPIKQLFNGLHTKACLAGWVEVFENQYSCVIFSIETSRHQNNFTKNFTSINLNNLLNNR